MIKYFYYCTLLLAFTACREQPQFELMAPANTGIDFINQLDDNDTLNILDVENLYNGGGIGIGDFNGDSLQDIYFAANAVSFKLYLNKGNFTFQDVTKDAGVAGEGRWGRGVSIVDINNDGRPDIYISCSLDKDPIKRENLLYINKGNGKNGVPTFVNEARTYGLADTSHATMAAFFDYDNDGDLDMYQLVNEITKGKYPNTFRPILTQGENPNTDKLYRNDWDSVAGHPVFTNVSAAAGIGIEGYGHGVNICDINRDGWKDVYVTNDFLSNNILYINQKDGTFRDEIRTYFKHTSENAMGQDIIDINNDGLADVVELDMNPEDNYRKKMMLNPLNYRRYQNNDVYGYQHQYVRNALQVNQGPRPGQDTTAGIPVFSDVSFYAGIAETDWSWTPVVTDFDNNGFRDIIITNGFPKDVTDHDFMLFRNKASTFASKREILEEIPKIKIPNYAYRNDGELHFTDVTKDWGLDQPSFANGAVYADFDNDGDMDLVINNINEPAAVYRNHARDADEAAHFLQVRLQGAANNRDATGAMIELRYGHGARQVYEYTPYRGYLSSVQPIAHFGLDSVQLVDSILVTWPNGQQQLLQGQRADQLLTIRYDVAAAKYASPPVARSAAWFADITDLLGFRFKHSDSDFVDFNIQKLLPHKLSEFGPALAAGDVNGDGLDDLVAGGSQFHHATIFVQQLNGSFLQQVLDSGIVKNAEDMGVLLFDADADGDNDLYVASGGYEATRGDAAYNDRLYVNDGKGKFVLATGVLPANPVSKSCVRAADYDHDGDLDLFVAGRVDPGNYPLPVSSFIYRNDSQKGLLRFTDVCGIL